MSIVYRNWFRLFSILLKALLILVIVSVIWQFADIQLRLSRNGKIAQRLVEMLKVRFPGSEFRGVASYEREVIYITVINRLDAAERKSVESWLRDQKIEQNIAARIWLRFADDLDKEIIIE